jgi:hypothetical protein
LFDYVGKCTHIYWRAANKSNNAAADIVNLSKPVLTVKVYGSLRCCPAERMFGQPFFPWSAKPVLSDFVSYTANPLYFWYPFRLTILQNVRISNS